MQKVLDPHPNLSERIRSLVRRRIVDGELAPDTRINEVHLARELGVSRTPLREALIGLVAEGALRQEPRRGFFVLPLSVEEFQHIYPIRQLLDPAALRLGGLPGPARLDRLEALNEELRRESRAEARIRLDDAWHLELVAGCPNPVLLDLIRQFMRRTRRYEIAYYREARNLELSLGDHERVHAACRSRDLGAAVEALEDNLTGGIEPILAWLTRREAASPDDSRSKENAP